MAERECCMETFMEMNEITDAVEINSPTKSHEQGSKTSVSESSVDKVEGDPGFFNFLKELAMEKFYTNFSERGIVEINHLEDVSEADADEFKFLSTFQFRRLLRKYKEICQSQSSSTTQPSTSSTILYRTSHQSSVVSLPSSFRNFFETRDGMGNVVVKTDALKRQFKNLWHENPQNPTQHMSNSIILQMAASRMQFAKSQRECELWCRKERAKRTKLMLASCKTPVIDTWTPYYKQMSVYGKLEILKQKYPTAGPFLQLDSATITSSIYEILCKYLVGLCDIQEFARKAVAECKTCIIASKNEEYKEPNKFYIGQQCLLEEALTFITEHTDACSGIVEEARSKYKSSSSNKELMRKMNKRAKMVEVDSE